MKSGRLITIVFLACALTAAGALTYKRWPRRTNSVKREPPQASNQQLVSSIPPFSTKEPDRYQATRVITSVNSDTDQDVTRILIARDGDRRREDYDPETELRTSYLEIPEGTFVLLPSQKLYADMRSVPGGPALPNQRDEDSEADFSPELNETPSAALYEKLGSEKLDGRATAKYRVTSVGSTNGTEPPSVTLIWIDQELGIPIRSETELSDNSHHAKITIELRDIKPEVDANFLELPRDYKKVEYSELSDRLKQARVTRGMGSGKP